MKKTRKFLSLVMAVLMLCSCFVVANVQGATFNDINQSGVFVKQQTNYTCTLAAAVMLVRRTAMAAGNNNWGSITESAMRGTAWLEGSGLYYNFTYAGVSVGHASISGDVRLAYINLLNKYPQGVVAYNPGWNNQSHAVLLTDYDGKTDTFYCSDPANGAANGRIPLTSSSIKGQGANGQNDKLSVLTEYWYVKSPSVNISNDTQKPVISNVKIVDNNSTGYTVTCTATDNVGVTRVAFPTWTHHKGQDDIVWKDGNKSGNTFSIRINKSEHNGESDWYATHIYAYDAAGNVSNCIAKDILVPPDGKIAEATYNGNRYIVYKGKVTHQYAVDLCESYGGHLAAITSAGENSVVANLVAKVGTCWIDGSDAEQEGLWKFSDGTKMTYFNWQEGEPNSYMGTDQDYLAMVPRGEWDDTHTFPDPGSGDGGFVCEIEHTHSYTSSVTTQPTCTSTGVKTFTCSCGASYTETIAKTSHNSNTKIPAVAPTCRETGLTEGKKCSVCGTVTVAQQIIDKVDCVNNDGDDMCDYCEKDMPINEPDISECSCSCHKGGISGFFFKLILFFQRIFGMNKECKCGIAHY